MVMEALFGVCLNSLFSSIQNHRNTISLSFLNPARLPFNSQLKSQSWVSLTPRDFHALPPCVVSKKRVLKCISGKEQLELSVDEGERLKNGVRSKNLAVFVSGGGSNFRAIHEAILRGEVHGRFVVLVTNKHDCGGAQYARENGIPVIIHPSAKHLEAKGTMVQRCIKLLLLLEPGPTIHFVDENYDTGRILAQRIVPVLANDTAEELAGRVLLQEHKMYAEVASAICEERVIWREDGVPLIRNKANPEHYS